MNNDDIKKPAKARQVDTSDRYLAFLVGKEQYAIPLLQVKEVIEMSEPTPIPQTSTYFKGVINLRGQVISVLDLRLKLNQTKIENGPKTSIIILDIEPTLCLGVIVDRINNVLAFHPEDVSAPPDASTGTDQFLTGTEQFLTGIARRDNKMTLILDIRAALNIKELNYLKNNSQEAA